jgi:16S rRNA (guanine527-N7)-methyltransferase
MNPARISELLFPFIGELDEFSAQKLLPHISTYIDILQRWNARMNLTAIRDPEDILTRHFGESLFAARHLFPNRLATDSFLRSAETSSQLTLADLGSGAGFPGIPIKLWAPGISLTLIESKHKKATFLREIARALTLTDINIQNTRAETLPQRTFDIVTMRAVERFEAVLPAAARLATPKGTLALLIGTAQLAQARAILPDHEFSTAIPIPLSSARVLIVAHEPEPTS